MCNKQDQRSSSMEHQYLNFESYNLTWLEEQVSVETAIVEVGHNVSECLNVGM